MLYCSVIDYLQGAPLQSLNRIPTCCPPLPPIVAQPDHTVLVRVSDNFLGYYLTLENTFSWKKWLLKAVLL